MNFHPNRGLQQSEDSHDDVITVGEVNLQAEKNSDDAMGFFSNKKISWELKGYIFFSCHLPQVIKALSLGILYSLMHVLNVTPFVTAGWLLSWGKRCGLGRWWVPWNSHGRNRDGPPRLEMAFLGIRNLGDFFLENTFNHQQEIISKTKSWRFVQETPF